ncbi:hypothetical protein BU23DRAFT_636784 [Bimuria novae-zelandiae CBS 107.79]|uniref:BRCT domain-containing protein n=1 Tax=Bimuria novae-zelandiae CBS 107.79 TaxID=1447943 RepID=A0A6A5VSQ3_9PLEO|nr:hypothetical protein BU23DRAFT_636784 [Bimuria novae-zelandiae CBS 107.79]
MNPSSASQTAAKPSASSSAPVHAPPTLPSGVAASARTFFDPWNSSSTGHQRAENRPSGSTSWRQSRSLKLEQQYRGGLGGGKRVADTVGAGSADFGNDGRKANRGWEKGPKGLRTGGQQSLAKVWGKSKASMTAKRLSLEEKLTRDDALRPDTPDGADEMPPEKQIFRGLCFYITGSTMPLISDHKLKYVLTQHGASQSIALGRRTVTHVILGTTCGGGLAGSKLQKEITKTRGNTVKYISVEWVLESIKAEKRLPESRFSPVKLAAERQSSVLAFGAGGATRPAAK